jgi:hypothetical protein
MRWQALAIGLLAACWSAAAAAQDAPASIGTVTQQSFNGAVGTLQQTRRDLVYNLPVYGDEQVSTGNKGTTALQFIDRTTLQVGANSNIMLDRFVYDPAKGTGDAALRFSSGVFRFVSGTFKNKDGYQLTTPSASLSIRGTKVVVFVDDRGNSIFYFEEGKGVAKDACGNVADVLTGQSALVKTGCGITVFNGNLVPTDALGGLEPAAGPEDAPDPPGPSPDAPGRGNRASPS